MKGQTSGSHICLDIFSLDNFGNSLLLLDLNENFLSFMSDEYGENRSFPMGALGSNIGYSRQSQKWHKHTPFHDFGHTPLAWLGYVWGLAHGCSSMRGGISLACHYLAGLFKCPFISPMFESAGWEMSKSMWQITTDKLVHSFTFTQTHTRTHILKHLSLWGLS